MSYRGRHVRPLGATVILIMMVAVLIAVAVALIVSAPAWAGLAAVCLPSCVPPTTSQCHCAACHETFGGVWGFDAHRQGPVHDRGCLSPEAIGLVKDERGVWRRVVARLHPRAIPRQEATVAVTTGDAVSSAAKSPGHELEVVTGVDG